MTAALRNLTDKVCRWDEVDITDPAALATIVQSSYFFVIFHMGGPVYWETRKHELPAFGAGEDEYMTQAHARIAL